MGEVGEVRCCCYCYWVWVGGRVKKDVQYIQRSLGALGRKVVRVWDGAGRCNGQTRSERCFLIEMDRPVKRTENQQTDIMRPRDLACRWTDSLLLASGKAGKR